MLPSVHAFLAGLPSVTLKRWLKTCRKALCAAGPPLPSSHPASGSQLSAFSNGGGSAFSPIAPMQGSGIPAASAHSMGRQPSDTWNVCLWSLSPLMLSTNWGHSRRTFHLIKPAGRMLAAGQIAKIVQYKCLVQPLAVQPGLHYGPSHKVQGIAQDGDNPPACAVHQRSCANGQRKSWYWRAGHLWQRAAAREPGPGPHQLSAEHSCPEPSRQWAASRPVTTECSRKWEVRARSQPDVC